MLGTECEADRETLLHRYTHDDRPDQATTRFEHGSKLVCTIDNQEDDFDEVPGAMSNGLSVRCYSLGKPARSGRQESVNADRRIRPASVIQVLDSLHFAKVVEGDFAWP